jgi:hypothetical protein
MKRTKENATVHLFRVAELPEVYTPLRGAARKERATSESRIPYEMLRRVAVPFFTLLLGCVKWRF